MKKDEQIEYVADKPSDCQYCYWYDEDKKCKRKRCYYIKKKVKKKKSKSNCEGCPYKPHGSNCVGYCTEKILKDWKGKNKKKKR